MGLLQAPTYFNLKETNKGTVLVESGRLVKEDVSKQYGNRQFYFEDSADSKLKCLSGGSLAYIVDLHSLGKQDEVKITYNGTEEITNGKFAGKSSHQFLVEKLNDDVEETTTEDSPKDFDANSLE